MVRAEALASASTVSRLGGEKEQALNLSTEAVKTAPDFSPALAAHATSLAVNGRRGEGISYAQRAIDANPRISKNYLILGVMQGEEKDYINSIDNLKKALEKLENDNTLLGSEDKAEIRGLITYQLAKFYWASDTTSDGVILELIESSIKSYPRLKNNLKRDFSSGEFFNDLGTNDSFTRLIDG